jgi:hypothetical protein
LANDTLGAMYLAYFGVVAQMADQIKSFQN